MNYELTASIVTYNNDKNILSKAIRSFLNTNLRVKLFLVDNSLEDDLKVLTQIDESRIEYIHNPSNPGFGAAHNLILRKIDKLSPYHIVINPDVYFDVGTNEQIIEYLNSNLMVGLLMPKILYPDGSLQHVAKLLPTPFNLFVRRFVPFKSIVNKFDYNYELRFSDFDKIMNIPFFSGCYMVIRTSILSEVGYFDENMFMYLEDADFSRRVHKKYKTSYFPLAIVYHEYERGAHKNKKLLMIFIKSAIYYFGKWGWFLDKERTRMNKNAIKNILNGE